MKSELLHALVEGRSGTEQPQSGAHPSPQHASVPSRSKPELDLRPVDAVDLENELYTQGCDPQRQKEKPVHRLMAVLAAQGLSPSEIAEHTGMKVELVRSVLREPWAKRVVAQLLMDRGRQAAETILKSAASDSVFTLIELRDTAKSEAVRKGCADSILDRYLGKPTQYVKSEKVDKIMSPREKDKELDSEIARLAGEIQLERK